MYDVTDVVQRIYISLYIHILVYILCMTPVIVITHNSARKAHIMLIKFGDWIDFLE